MDTAPSSYVSPRFTLELEFVLALSNPLYLQHLATAHPHLFIPPATDKSDRSDAATFAAYLEYLYTYWSIPEYAKFLTHPGAVLNTLKLLQQDQFRRDVIRPNVVEALLRGGQNIDGVKTGVVLVETEVTAERETGREQERMDESVG